MVETTMPCFAAGPHGAVMPFSLDPPGTRFHSASSNWRQSKNGIGRADGGSFDLLPQSNPKG
jgi:hypothetical protein